MSIVEAEYHRRMQAMSVQERVACAAALYQWTRETIARQIVRERGELSDEESKWRVAMRLYGRDKQAASLIARMLADVSR